MHRIPGATCASFLLASCLAGCGDLKDSYGKEYVIYDSKRGSAGARQTSAATATPAEFARILLLEQVRSELERAIADGLDTNGGLARKQRAVEDELGARLTAAGAQLAGWRAARAAELKAFLTQ